jgi:hypothetical protein
LASLAFFFTYCFRYNNIKITIEYFLRGQVKFLTGGDEANSFLVRDPVNFLLNGGSGETPGPTVKVWMGEGERRFNGGNLPFFKP